MLTPSPPNRFTVDDLFEAPDPGGAHGLRWEVVDGRLLLAPAPTRRHERVVANLAARFGLVLPGGARVRTHDAVRLPDGDGPVPDVLVTTAVDWPRGWPCAAVHTVVEVVGDDGGWLDRVWKRDGYARAGIPCYWRVEITARKWLRGPLPVLVVRWRERQGWREVVAAAGRWHTLPVAYGRDPAGAAVSVPVRLDPAALLRRPAAGW